MRPEILQNSSNFSLKTLNSPANYNQCAGFTIIEVMIVVAIIGILAAIIYPEVQTQSQKAKEAAAKENLQVVRQAIQRYALEHCEIFPGYNNNDQTTEPSWQFFFGQMLMTTDRSGKIATGSLGPYLKSIPDNPFNGNKTIKLLTASAVFADESTGSNGWLYKPKTGQIYIDWLGSDSSGIPYIDY